MKITKINFRQLAALCAILALTLVQGVAFTGAPSAANPAVLADPDLSSEGRTLENYFNELFAYKKQIELLDKKSSILRTEIAPLQQKSDNLKGQLSSVQNAIREIIRKFKAANAWEDLDTKLLANTTDPRERSFFQQSSFKRDLEDAASSLGSRGSEISNLIDNLRRKLRAQSFSPDEERKYSVVRVSYSPAAPMKFEGLDCVIGQIRFRLIKRLGGEPTPKTRDQITCACGNNVGFATGTPCAQVN
jgi:gas vesicle protein